MRALKAGRPLDIRVTLAKGLERLLVDDGSGDSLDALICAAQAAWGWTRRESHFGLPAGADSSEGWIVTS